MRRCVPISRAPVLPRRWAKMEMDSAIGWEMGVEFEAVVVDVREERRVAGSARWQLLLDWTRFDAGSRGTLEAVSRNGALLRLPVLATERDGSGDLGHVVEKPLMTGTVVRGVCESVSEP